VVGSRVSYLGFPCFQSPVRSPSNTDYGHPDFILLNQMRPTVSKTKKLFYSPSVPLFFPECLNSISCLFRSRMTKLLGNMYQGTVIADNILLLTLTHFKVGCFKFRIVFWDVLPCKIIVDWRFRGTCCLHHPWNVGRQLFYTAMHPRRQFWTSYSPPWELEISHRLL
jgi:hypothetical protein